MCRQDEGEKRRTRRRLLGWLQNLVIVLLLISTAALVAETGVLDLSGRLGTADQGQAGLDQLTAYTAAARPFCMVLTPETGVHGAIMYNSDELELAYERYSTALAEALGSSGEPEPISDEQWQAALHGPGIYFDYYGDFQLSILAIWLGTQMNGEA